MGERILMRDCLSLRELLLLWERCIHMAMQVKQPATTMARRALLTDRERELISDEDPDKENYKYQAISRARSKIQDELPKDVELLAEHHPRLFSELKGVVCEDTETVSEYLEQLQNAQGRIDETAGALDEIEEAFERGDPDAAREALERAQEAISDGDLDDQ